MIWFSICITNVLRSYNLLSNCLTNSSDKSQSENPLLIKSIKFHLCVCLYCTRFDTLFSFFCVCVIVKWIKFYNLQFYCFNFIEYNCHSFKRRELSPWPKKFILIHSCDIHISTYVYPLSEIHIYTNIRWQ